MRLVIFSVNHHVLPVILASLVTVSLLTLLLPSFLCIRILPRRSLSWDSLTVLDDWTPLMWIFLTEALTFTLDDIIIMLISPYYLTLDTYGGCTWYSSIWSSRGVRLCFLTSSFSFEMYLFCPFGWCSLSFLSAGDLLRDSWYPSATEVDILTQIRQRSELIPRWYGG